MVALASLGLWTDAFVAAFHPPKPYILEAFSDEEIMDAYDGYSIASATGVGSEGIRHLIAGTASVRSTDVDIPVLDRLQLEAATLYARALARIDQRSGNLLAVIALTIGALTLPRVGYRWHDVAFFAIPVLNLILGVKLLWRLSQLPARPWAEASPLEPT